MEPAVSSYFHISFDRSGLFNVNDCPAGLEAPAGARNRKKATVKIRRNTASGFIRQDPIIVFTIKE